MSKMYAYMTTAVYRPNESHTSARGHCVADAQWFAAELNALLARAEQAERDRDVLAKVVDQTMKSFGYFIDPAEYAALSRCTPPASKEATNG